jgi:hypothetical protein
MRQTQTCTMTAANDGAIINFGSVSRMAKAEWRSIPRQNPRLSGWPAQSRPTMNRAIFAGIRLRPAGS